MMTKPDRLPLCAKFFSGIGFAALAAITLTSCGSTGGGASTRNYNFDPIAGGSSRTPPHNMSRYEYPFDDAGNYIDAWAIEGERRAGRSIYNPTSRISSSSSSRSKKSSSSSSRSSSKKPSTRYHTVSRGDTLWSISRRYGKSVSAIKSANGLRSDAIRPGQRLRIP